jgi:1,2-diacylglycerol 3-alpha-glucosyltransferase
MSQLHIAHFTNTYLPVTSGVVRSVRSFRQALVDLGHLVFVFAQHAHDYVDEEPFVFRYPALELPLQEYPLTIPVSNFVEKLLPSLKLDVIHAHHPALLGQVAAGKAEDLDVPLVFTHHTRYQEYSHYVALPQELVKDAIHRWLADYMERCQHIVVPSESIKAILEERYGIHERVTAVPTGIDLAPYEKADGRSLRRQRNWEDKLVLISIGRLAEEKNFVTLLKAAAPVLQRHAQARLAIVGDGDDRPDLEKEAQKLGIADQVEFVGRVPFDKIPDYLKAADIFCFASITETQGLVTLEAMAAGLPVAAVDATGTSDAVTHGKEGLLTANDPQALGEAMERLISDESLRAQFAEAAYEKAKMFENKLMGQRLLDVYAQAQADKKANRYVSGDKRKPIFSINWRKLFGLEDGVSDESTRAKV